LAFFIKKKHLLGENLTATPQHQPGGVFWWLLFRLEMPCCQLASVRAAMGKSPNDSPGPMGHSTKKPVLWFIYQRRIIYEKNH